MRLESAFLPAFRSYQIFNITPRGEKVKKV